MAVQFKYYYAMARDRVNVTNHGLGRTRLIWGAMEKSHRRAIHHTFSQARMPMVRKSWRLFAWIHSFCVVASRLLIITLNP